MQTMTNIISKGEQYNPVLNVRTKEVNIITIGFVQQLIRYFFLLKIGKFVFEFT